MNLRKLMLPVVCLSFATLGLAQPGTPYLFQVPGANSGSGRILTYLGNDNNLLPKLDTTGPNNTRAIVGLPNGQGFYLISDGPLQFLSADLHSFSTLNSVAGPIDHARLSPDGRFLFVFGAHLYVVDTNSNTLVQTDPGVAATPIDIAFSSDATQAWLLQQSVDGGLVTPIDMLTLTAGASLPIERAGNQIVLGPRGALYVVGTNEIHEYDPATLTLQAVISMVAVPGPLHFTDDGSRAYFVNQTPNVGGYFALFLRTSERDVQGWRQLNNPPQFNDLLIAGSDRIYALEKNTNNLWELNPTSVTANVTTSPAIHPQSVYTAAISNESPSARFLYVIQQSLGLPEFDRIDLSNNTIQVETGATSVAGQLQFVGIPPQSGANKFVKINDNQTVTGGGPALPLVARVLDVLGRPVFNQAVTFSSSISGVSISVPTSVTNVDGYVQTGVSVPLLPGSYTVTLTAGAASTAYTILVPGAGGGNPNPSSLVSIVQGDGQILREQLSTNFTHPWAAPTVQVVDADGNPQVGVLVNFTVTQGTGIVNPDSAFTDDHGQASTNFTSLDVPYPLGFQDNILHAETPSGSVDFNIIVYKLESSGTGQPSYTNPDTNSSTWPRDVNVGRGDVVPNFFRVKITSTYPLELNAPIAEVTLRAADNNDATHNSTFASCANDTHSDNTGVAHCDLKLSCAATGDQFIRMVTGEEPAQQMLLHIGPGSSQKLSLVTGDGQTGTLGQVLGTLLTARVQDNCGSGIAGQSVVWTVLSGSATLSQVISTSGSDGTVSAKVTLGQTPGPVQVRVSMANANPVIFNLSNNLVIGSLSLVSGGTQTVLPNQAFPSPVIFGLKDNHGASAGAGYLVSFSNTGSATLSTLQTQTDANGQVLVNVTAGPVAGPVTVTATYLGFSSTATLTVGTPPLTGLTPSSFRNNASLEEGMVPCGLVTLTGTGIAPGVAGILSGVDTIPPYPFVLGQVRLFVNEVPAPLRALVNQGGVEQVIFQTPCETPVASGIATVRLQINGNSTTINNVKVFQAQPGIYSFTYSDNATYGYVIRSNGTYVTPDNLATTGENLYLYVTGLGQANPTLLTGAFGNNQQVVLQSQVGVDDAGVPTQTPIYLPGTIGVYLVPFQIPKATGVAPGTVIKRSTIANPIHLAVFVILNGQVKFGNPTALAGWAQGQ